MQSKGYVWQSHMSGRTPEGIIHAAGTGTKTACGLQTHDVRFAGRGTNGWASRRAAVDHGARHCKKCFEVYVWHAHTSGPNPEGVIHAAGAGTKTGCGLQTDVVRFAGRNTKGWTSERAAIAHGARHCKRCFPDSVAGTRPDATR